MNFFQKITDTLSLNAEEGNIKRINEKFDRIPNNESFKIAFLSMQKNYFVLRERYTHELDKKLQIIQDWSKYAQALYKIRSVKNTNEADRLNIIMQEIERRFEEML